MVLDYSSNLKISNQPVSSWFEDLRKLQFICQDDFIPLRRNSFSVLGERAALPSQIKSLTLLVDLRVQHHSKGAVCIN
jgi:hypothetical protein